MHLCPSQATVWEERFVKPNRPYRVAPRSVVVLISKP
jgi:hypothetical protein